MIVSFHYINNSIRPYPTFFYGDHTIIVGHKRSVIELLQKPIVSPHTLPYLFLKNVDRKLIEGYRDTP